MVAIRTQDLEEIEDKGKKELSEMTALSFMRSTCLRFLSFIEKQ